MLYRYAIDSFRTQIELIQGNQLNDDPYVLEFPNIPNTKYGILLQNDFSKQGYVQFIPICTAQDSTSYE